MTWLKVADWRQMINSTAILYLSKIIFLGSGNLIADLGLPGLMRHVYVAEPCCLSLHLQEAEMLCLQIAALHRQALQTTLLLITK